MTSINATVSTLGAATGATKLRWPELQGLEILLATAIFIAIKSLRQKKQQGLPVWPVVGMLPSLLAGLRRNPYEWFTTTLINQGGTFVFKGPSFTSLNCVVTADPRNLEHLLKTKFASFPKGEYFRSLLRDLLGGGIFNADDDAWRQQRKTASIQFHSSEFRALTASSLVELVHGRLLPVLRRAAERGSSLDLQNILLRLTFDNVCMIAFGVDPRCLSPGLPEIPFARAFEDATEAATLRFVMPVLLWKAMRLLDIGSERKLRRSIAAVDDFAREVITTRKKELEAAAAEESPPASQRSDLLTALPPPATQRSDLSTALPPPAIQRSDLLTAFMRLKDEAGKPYTDEFLRDICVNFILAGRDTSSVALAWFFWLLNENPTVEARILRELHGIVRGRVEDNAEVVFSPEEVKKMEYLQAALSEALRLYPSVPVDHKEVVEDETLPDGRILKKGTKVLYAIYAMGRMESIWGKDCAEFRPERWLRDGKFMSESAYKFTAFNGGPRLCLGKDFAYYQMKFVAASVIYQYHVKMVKNHPIVPKLSLTMYMKYGLKVEVTRRDDIEFVGLEKTTKC